ncbi:MAG TPA: hypothetical protein VE715_04735 [Blastocatellia bacterium]|nr:hypothetical protein [Blastocatellia bacterium]
MKNYDSGGSALLAALIGDETDKVSMNLKLSNAISVFVCLLAAAAFAQSTPRSSDPEGADAETAEARQSPQIVYTTPAKTSVAKLKIGESEACEVRGKVAFTITAANYDDTMVGTLVFAIPEDSRKKIAEVSGEPLTSIPASVARKDVVAGFRKGTSCPIVSIEIGATELDLAGVKLSFNRVVVNVIENTEEVPRHFCVWTRQINANRPHRGVIASLNRLITVEQ